MALSRYEKQRSELRIHENEDDLSSDFAQYIEDISEASIRDRGVFTIALSGGSVISLLRKLCVAPYIKTVDWARWHVFWVDERVVSKSHVDSNYKLAKDEFFSKVPIIHSNIHPINDSLTAKKAAEAYEFTIRQLVKARVISVSKTEDCPNFDLILLEVGPDGQVGSLFPDCPAVRETDPWVSFMTDCPEPPPERITFTFPVINSASNVGMVALGRDRAEAVKSGSGSEWAYRPVGLVRPVGGRLVWFLDREAASKLIIEGGTISE